MERLFILEKVVTQVEVDGFYGFIARTLACDGFAGLPLEQARRPEVCTNMCEP